MGRLEVFVLTSLRDSTTLHEKNKQDKKRFEVVLDEANRQKLQEILNDLQNLIVKPTPPEPVFDKKCKKCAYYEYCFL